MNDSTVGVTVTLESSDYAVPAGGRVAEHVVPAADRNDVVAVRPTAVHDCGMGDASPYFQGTAPFTVAVHGTNGGCSAYPVVVGFVVTDATGARQG